MKAGLNAVVNILLEGYGIQAQWLFDELKKYLKSTHHVAVVAFSFRDNAVRSILDWNSLYGKENGRLYQGIVSGFKAYGIPEDNISFVNYFTDTKESASEIIKSADIVYFPGGLPDRMMERIIEFDLQDSLARHTGIIMGYSAGAVIQLCEYHLSPDRDYPEFKYYKGLQYIDDFYLEVHYEGTEEQIQSIKKVIKERNKKVYATSLMKGAILIHDGEIKLLGDVKCFEA